MLKINNLTIKYDKEILKDVEFHAYRGFVHLIRGESGSGKTTLLYRLGLISSQTKYEYTIDDVNVINKEDMRRNMIAFLLQNAMLLREYTVAENIIFSAHIVDKMITDNDILEILKEVDLNVPLNQDIQTLSGGERQRLAIACALIKDTDIIILDEPTSSLDKVHEKEIFQLLKDIAHNKNKCIIISSHSQQAIQYSDIIYEIKDKKLVLVKETFNDSLFEDKISHFKFYNILNYIKKHLVILKKKTISIILLLLISYLFLMAINTVLDIMQENSITDITKLSENQLFITTENNNIYVDNEQLDDIFDNTIIYKKYGYLQSYLMIDDIKVDIIPLFEENDISNKYEAKYNILDANGIIYSQSLYKYLKRNNMTVTKFDNEIIIDNNTYHYQCGVKGVLKEGVLNNYTNNEYYVYLPYNVLQNLSNSSHYVGYTLFTKDLESYNHLIDILKTKQVDINDTFINITSINEVINNTRQLKIIITVITSIIILIMNSYILLHHFNLRKKEFVVDIVFGFSLKNILSIIKYEILFYMIFTLIILSIISCIIHYSITQLIVITSIISILSYIICMIDMRKLSVENILRD